MTVPLCLEFCASNGTQYQYAGLEWSRYVPISNQRTASLIHWIGRECWCSPYLSSLSTKLDDDECKNPCEGNSSQVCGGPLKLSVYELSKGGDTPDRAAMLQIPGGMAVLSILSVLFLWS